MSHLEARHLVKTYAGGAEDVVAVNDVSISLEACELAILKGPSGSGKTTLLSILGCVLRPDIGSLQVCDNEVLWDESPLPLYRREYFGFVFQHFNLIASLTVRRNVEVPLLLNRVSREEREERVEEALKTVSLIHRADFYPAQLSGGEKQRAAVARATAADPPIVLADEPTGNLDSANGRQVMTMLRTLATDHGKAVFVVTHDPRYVRWADMVYTMEDGELVRHE